MDCLKFPILIILMLSFQMLLQLTDLILRQVARKVDWIY
jgi:hypothetical protein